MRKLLLLVFALLGIAVQGLAQVALEFPKFTKVLQVLSKGINVRAEPSTQSDKIANGPDMLLVIDETAEWYHAYVIIGGRLLSKPGYLSKKVCRVKQPKTIDTNYVKRSFGEQALQVGNRTSGKYSGWTIISYRLFSLGWEQLYVFVGKPVGNSYIGKLYPYQSVDDNVLIYSTSFQSNKPFSIPSNRLGGANEEDFMKLTDNDIDKLMTLMTKNEYTILYADKVSFEYSNGAYDPPTVESGEGVETIELDISGFQGSLGKF